VPSSHDAERVFSSRLCACLRSSRGCSAEAEELRRPGELEWGVALRRVRRP